MAPVTLLSWNVNGIRAVQRKKALEWFYTEQPDIFCIQETKAHPEQLTQELTDPEGYHVSFSSAEKKGYSGVATYSRKKPVSVTEGLGIKRFDSEGRVLISDFDSFVLLNVYFPNGNASKERLAYKMDFYDAFLEYVVELTAAGRHVVFCGDVNTAHKEIDLARPKANEKNSGFLPEERAWIDQVIECGFQDTLREFHEEPELYSWWDYKTKARERNVGWRIDYVFSDSGMRANLIDAGIRTDIMGSDHCPVWVKIEI